MNFIAIKGRLVRDPELKNTGSGKSVCTITVAVDRSYKKDGETQADFFDCVFWEQAAEFVSKYFHKGQEIIITGEMQSRKWQDKEGNNRTSWEIQRAHAEFCGPKQDGGYSAPASYGYAAQGGVAAGPGDFAQLEDDDSELPF